MIFTWDPSMTTGARSVDEQHKELFLHVAALKDSMMQGKGREEIKRLLDFLGNYVVKHFAEEEQLMAKHGCPAAAANRAAHQAFLAKFQQMRERLDSAGAGPTLVLEAYDAVSTWLVDHIRKIDTQLLASIQASKPEPAAAR